MSDRSFQEFLQELEIEGVRATEEEQALLHSNVTLTTPRFSPQQLASSAARIARQLQHARRQREAVQEVAPGMATVVAPAPGRPAPAARPASPPPPQVQRRRKFCRKCGNALQAGKRFCTGCGSPID